MAIAAIGLAFAAVGCGDDGDSASTTEPTASLTSAAITETDLVVTDCDNDLASGIVLEAIKGSFLLQVDAPGGTGSISYTTGAARSADPRSVRDFDSCRGHLAAQEARALLLNRAGLRH